MVNTVLAMLVEESLTMPLYVCLDLLYTVS